MPPRKRLGQLLTELGVIDEHQLQSALGHQKQWGGKLGAVLVQKGFCKEPEVVVALSRHLGMPAVKLLEAKVDPRAVSFVSKQIAEKLHVFPYDVSGTGRSEVVTIAMSDPTDLSAVDQLAFHTGKRIKPMLAGDSEIVHAIQQHYGGGEEKDKAAAAAKATASAAAVAKAARPGAPAATPAFSRRVEPPIQSMPTPPGGSIRVAPYIPPPIPAAPPKPAPKLEEIEPDVEEMAAAAAPSPEPLEIPEDDGQMMGLEPIAAHSQFGEEVAGAEEVAGEGSAADSMEGLESASLPHGGAETAQQMEGLEPVAAHSQEPTTEGGWGQDSAGSWDAAPTGEEAAPPSRDFGSANDWSSEEAAAGGEQGWGEQAKAKDTTGEELPVDAILGEASTEQPPQEQSEPPPPEEAQHKEPATAEPAAAEAPDAWASSEDPLAAQAEQQPAEGSWAEPASAEETPPAEAAAETAAESVTAETEAPPEWGETEEQPAAQEAAPEQPAEEKAREEQPVEEQQAQPAAEQPPVEEPAAEEPAAEEPAAEFEIPPEEFSEEQGEMKIEGWVAPPREPEPQGAGWLGEALEATTPLSPADVGTLSSVGVDPNDGVAPLRALAAILRVLNRRQMLEVDEIANEIRASREQGAAYAAQQAGLANGTPGEEPAATEEAAAATEPAET
jgi:hypothetical protein